MLNSNPPVFTRSRKVREGEMEAGNEADAVESERDCGVCFAQQQVIACRREVNICRVCCRNVHIVGRVC